MRSIWYVGPSLFIRRIDIQIIVKAHLSECFIKASEENEIVTPDYHTMTRSDKVWVFDKWRHGTIKTERRGEMIYCVDRICVCKGSRGESVVYRTGKGQRSYLAVGTSPEGVC